MLRRIIYSSVALSLLVVLLRLLGFAEKKTLSFLFGAGDAMDVWFLALQISLMASFFLKGVFHVALIPLLSSARNRGRENAAATGSAAFWLVAGTGAFVLVPGYLFTGEIVRFFAPGFSASKQLLAVEMVQSLLPVSVIVSTTYLFSLSLQVQKRFEFAASADHMQKIVFIACLFLFVIRNGFSFLVVAYWLSALVPLLVLSGYHWKRFGEWATLKVRIPAVWAILALAGPTILGNVVSQAGRAFQTRMASGLPPGTVSGLMFAQVLVDLPLMLVPASLTAVLFVYFSDFAERKELHLSRAYLVGSARILFVLFLPAAVFYVLESETIVALLFGDGAFGESSIAVTSAALLALGLGMPFFALEMVLVTYFQGHQRIVLAVGCGLAGVFAGAVGIWFLTPVFGIAGVALYLPIARAVKVATLIFFLRRLDFRVPYRSAILFCAKVAFCVLVAGGIVELVPLPAGSGFLLGAASLGTRLLLALLIYGALLNLLRVRETTVLIEGFKRLRAARRNKSSASRGQE
ncbi:MAG: lipid II flippase MurJ [Sumerlaeia bacterium]